MSIKNKTTLMDNRTAFKPFNYPWCFDAWLNHERSHWLHTEVSMGEDLKDWKEKLSDEERQFLTHIFRFFTQGDIDVSDGYVNNYIPYFPQPEVRMMLLGFAAREALHVAAYSHLVETLGLPETTYNQFLEYSEMKEKHEYTNSFNSSSDPKDIAKNIAIFSAFTEGLQLFSSFIMLLNFPRNGTMKGMGQIVSWSIIDETSHCENMIKLFKEFIRENRNIWTDEFKKEIYDICRKVVELEDNFIDLAFSLGPMKNLTSDDVKKYVRYIADRRLISLGLKGNYKIKKNPLPWVEDMINAPIHANFFEGRSVSYSKGSMKGSWEDIWA